jgi:hypothetical protein
MLLFLSLLLLRGAPALAHGASAGDMPLTSGTLRLQHRSASEIVALFAREQAPGSGSGPRGARAGNPGCLLPGEIDALMRGAGDELVAVGAEDRFDALAECIRVLDVPIERTGPDHERIVLTLRRADAARIRSAALALPGAGSLSADGRQLVLEGSRGWMHRALREVIRAELREAPRPAR